MNVEHPSYSLLFLLAPVALFLYVLLFRYRKKILAQFGTKEILQKITPFRNETFFWLRVLCIAQAFIFGSLALMQPVVTGQEETLEGPQSLPQESYDEVAIILDVSSSMGAQDASEHDSRFQRAKEITEAVVEHLGGMSIALYSFAGTCENEVPETMDYLYFRIILDALAINAQGVAGTDFSALIDTLEKKYLQSKVQKKTRIILLTDGEDTTFLYLGPAEKEKKEAALLKRLAAFKKAGIAIDVVGLGSKQMAVIPNFVWNSKLVYSAMRPDFIKAFADQAGGHSYFDESLSLTRIVDGLVANIARQEINQENNQPEKNTKPLFGYPLFAAILFLAISIILPERLKP